MVIAGVTFVVVAAGVLRSGISLLRLAVLGGVAALLVIGNVLLRSSPAAAPTSFVELEQQLRGDRPTLVEFYSNY